MTIRTNQKVHSFFDLCGSLGWPNPGTPAERDKTLGLSATTDGTTDWRWVSLQVSNKRKNGASALMNLYTHQLA